MEEFRAMRRSDRAMTEAEARQLLAGGEYGVLSMCGEGEAGYGVPLSYAVDGEKIYFHAAKEGRKLEELRRHPRASFCVVGRTELLPEKFSTRFESVIAEGEVSEIEGEEKLAALRALAAKYSPEFLAEGVAYIARAAGKTTVLRLTLRHLSGKHRL
jgi:hypothetical protein